MRGDRGQLVVRDRVERPDLAAVTTRQLVEPDVGALGEQDQARHPLPVAGEALGLRVGSGERGSLAAAIAAPGTTATEPEMERPALFREEVLAADEPLHQVGWQERAPALADVAELRGE